MKHFYTLILSCLSVSLYAQEQIDTDRPDQTESAFLVPKKWFQFEAGFNFQKKNSTENESLTPTLLSKYGLSKRIEFRIITSLKTNSSSATSYGTINETGLDVVEVGAKISLTEEKYFLPKTSFIFHLGIPGFTSVKFKPDKIAPNFRFTMQHTLSPKISLGYNAGCEWDGFTNDPAYIYTVTLGFSPAKKWYSYIEGFGAFKKKIVPEHNFDGGLAYFISNNFKADISSGFGLTNTAAQWYIAIGLSARFNLSVN